jgi:ABC-type lipoprotein export system ATPase subunit
MLRMHRISKWYQKGDERVTALAHLDVQLNPGEFTAIQGVSGSGKTTLLLIAGGLLHPDEGEVFLNDRNFYGMSTSQRAAWRARHIGFVFQQYHLLPYLTVLENIMVPQVTQKQKQNLKRAMVLLSDFGLAHRQAHFPGELSAGEKQRTALARALLLQPSLILADEITGNLDRENARVVVQYLRDFATAGGAILLVTHDDETAQKADKIITLTLSKSGD